MWAVTQLRTRGHGFAPLGCAEDARSSGAGKVAVLGVHAIVRNTGRAKNRCCLGGHKVGRRDLLLMDGGANRGQGTSVATRHRQADALEGDAAQASQRGFQSVPTGAATGIGVGAF